MTWFRKRIVWKSCDGFAWESFVFPRYLENVYSETIRTYVSKTEMWSSKFVNAVKSGFALVLKLLLTCQSEGNAFCSKTENSFILQDFDFYFFLWWRLKSFHKVLVDLKSFIGKASVEEVWFYWYFFLLLLWYSIPWIFLHRKVVLDVLRYFLIHFDVESTSLQYLHCEPRVCGSADVFGNNWSLIVNGMK